MTGRGHTLGQIWHVICYVRVCVFVRVCVRVPDVLQFVSQNGESSSPQMIKTGVTQGHALGLLLFLIFINDLPQHITNAQSNILADKRVIYNGYISKWNP